MEKYILGFNADDNICPDIEPQKLRQYASKEQAAYESEEWCEVEAKSLEDAKNKYETAFLNWQKSFNNENTNR